MQRQIVVIACVLAWSLAAQAYAQPSLSVTPLEVPPGASVTAVITGSPGQAWGLGGSFSGSGLTYAGLTLSLGADAVALGYGVFDGTGTTAVTFTPPIGPNTPLYYLQAITAADMSFAGAQPTQSLTLRPAGIFNNTPVIPQGLSAANARIRDVGTPTADSDAATKAYVDSVNGGTIVDSQLPANVARLNVANVFTAPATFSAGLSAANARIQNVGPPAQPMDAVNRLYVDANFTKLVTPHSALRSDGGFFFAGAEGVGGIPTTGPGVRAMWYPGKAAFRAGLVTATQWDDAKIGSYSFAGGYDATASGIAAVAVGHSTEASGAAAVALGFANLASGSYSLAAGAINRATGDSSTALGLLSQAAGQASAAIGLNVVACADASVVLGTNGSTSSAPTFLAPCGGTPHHGVFMFADKSTTLPFASAVHNEFAVRASGGFRFRTNSVASTGCNLPAGSGVFSCSSDRNLKAVIAEFDGEEVLRKVAAIPVTRWRFLDEATGVAHAGPMAQDFYAAFGLGDSDRMIGYTDINGINMRAIQALDARTRELMVAQGDVRDLRERIARLEELVRELLLAR